MNENKGAYSENKAISPTEDRIQYFHFRSRITNNILQSEGASDQNYLQLRNKWWTDRKAKNTVSIDIL